MGYGFLAQRYAPNQDLSQITPANQDAVVAQAEKDTIPNVFVTFWSFRIMMVAGLLLRGFVRLRGLFQPAEPA